MRHSDQSSSQKASRHTATTASSLNADPRSLRHNLRPISPAGGNYVDEPVGGHPHPTLLLRSRGEGPLSTSLSDPLAGSSHESYHTTSQVQVVMLGPVGAPMGPLGSAARSPSFFARQAAAAAVAPNAVSLGPGGRGGYGGSGSSNSVGTAAQPNDVTSAAGTNTVTATVTAGVNQLAPEPRPSTDALPASPASTAVPSQTDATAAGAPAAMAAVSAPGPARFLGFGALGDMTRRLFHRNSESNAGGGASQRLPGAAVAGPAGSGGAAGPGPSAATVAAAGHSVSRSSGDGRRDATSSSNKVSNTTNNSASAVQDRDRGRTVTGGGSLGDARGSAASSLGGTSGLLRKLSGALVSSLPQRSVPTAPSAPAPTPAGLEQPQQHLQADRVIASAQVPPQVRCPSPLGAQQELKQQQQQPASASQRPYGRAPLSIEVQALRPPQPAAVASPGPHLARGPLQSVPSQQSQLGRAGLAAAGGQGFDPRQYLPAATVGGQVARTLDREAPTAASTERQPREARVLREREGAGLCGGGAMRAAGSSAGRLPRQVSPEVSQVALLQMLHFGSVSGRVPLHHLSTLNVARLSRDIRALLWIGQGGGGAVFQGVWQGAAVAVKFMLAARPEHVDATALEAIVSLAVGHPNVVTTYGFDVTRLTEKSFYEIEQYAAAQAAQQLVPTLHQEDSSATALYNALMDSDASLEPSFSLLRLRSPHQNPSQASHQQTQTQTQTQQLGKLTGLITLSHRPTGVHSAATGVASAACGRVVSRAESLNMRVRKAQAAALVAYSGHPAEDAGGGRGSEGGSQTSAGQPESSGCLQPVPGTGVGAAAGGGGAGEDGGAATLRQVPSPQLPTPHHWSNETSGAFESAFNSEEGFGEPDLTDRGQSWNVRQVLTYLKARPGMYMTHIIMEYCDRGSLQSAIKRGIFRIDGLPDDVGYGGDVTGLRDMSGGVGSSRSGPAAAAAAAASTASVAGTSGAPQFTKRVVLRALLRTARDVAQGMSHLHANGIIHGDLKPGNVLLRGCRTDRRGFTALVGDFGLSKITRGDKPLELNHWSTVTVMAPEVIMGRWLKASDVFAFGILLWQLVTGDMMPYGKRTVQQVLVGVSQGVLKPEWPASAHPALVRLGRACLAHSPEKRPSFEAIVKILTKIEQHVRNEIRPFKQVADHWGHQSSAGLDSNSATVAGRSN